MDALRREAARQDANLPPEPRPHRHPSELVGRDAELARLTSIIDAVSTHVQIVLVGGDPWMGKTTLLARLAELGRSRRWTVLSGSAEGGPCSPPDGTPFEAFADAFDDLIARDRDRTLDRISPEHRQCLAALSPALSHLVPDGGSIRPPVEVNATNVIHSLMQSLSSPAGLLLVIDDAHLADPESLNLLCHLARHPPAEKLIIAVGYRRRQVGLRMLSLLGDLTKNTRTHQMEVGPLADEDAAALLPDDLTRLRRQELLRDGSGTPGVLRALGGSAGVPPDGSENLLQHVPQETLAACFRDFRALSRLGWLAAQAAAIVAEPGEADLIRAVAELTEVEIWTALDELTAADILRVDGSAHRFRFRDPVLRATAYRSAGTGWRIGAHRRAAAWLRAGSADPVVLAPHLLASDDARDAADVQIVLDASESVLWTAPARAVSWVRTTMDGLIDDGRIAARQRLLLGKGLTLTGPVREALAVLDETDESALPGQDALTELTLWRTRAARLLGRHADGAARLHQILHARSANTTDTDVRLHAESVALALEQDIEPDPGHLDTIRRQVDAADTTDTGLRAFLLALLGMADARQGKDSPAVRVAYWLTDALTDAEIIRHPGTLIWLARVDVRQGRLDRARAALERGLRISQRGALVGLIPEFATELALLAFRGGDLAAAEVATDHAVQAARLIGSEPLMAATRDLQGHIASSDIEGSGPAHGLSGTWQRFRVVDSTRRDAPDDGDDSPPEPEPELDRLSGRELEIALLVSEGRTNQQIARSLKLSHKTVETYLARIFKKLRVCSRTQVATMIGRRQRMCFQF